MYKHLTRGNEEEGPRLFSAEPTDKTRGNGNKSKNVKFQLNTKHIFTVRVVKEWNELPREAVESLSFETQQDRTLSNLQWLTLL